MKRSFPVYDICNLADDKSNNLLISRFGEYLVKHKNLHFPHKHSFYHLVLFTKGSGRHSIDFENFEVKPFQIYFMIPGQVHTWNFESETDGYIINFSAALFQSFLLNPNYISRFPFFSGNATDGVINIPENEQAKIRALFTGIIAENEHPNPENDLLISLILQLFIHVNRFSGADTEAVNTNYNYILLNNFKKLIEKYYLTLRLPKDYAELLYVTPNHLNALSKDILGISAGELIRKRVILEVKRLLTNKDLTVSEIADALNFRDNSYFSKFFKKSEGISPEEFRKKVFEANKITNTFNYITQ